MNTVKWRGFTILIDFAKCCDTCEYRPFNRGYSGHKNTAFCDKINCVVCRSNVCSHYVNSIEAKNKSIRGMKGQTNYMKSCYH